MELCQTKQRQVARGIAYVMTVLPAPLPRILASEKRELSVLCRWLVLLRATLTFGQLDLSSSRETIIACYRLGRGIPGLYAKVSS